MLDHAADPDRTARPELSDLIERLSRDSKRWADAEVAMARIELSDLKSLAVRAVGFAIVGFVAFFCALVALSQAGIALLTPLVQSPGIAALVVAALLMVLAGLCYYGMRSSLSWQAESVFFRWFAGAAHDARQP